MTSIAELVALLRAETLPDGVTREQVTATAADLIEAFTGAREEWAFGSTAWPDVFHPAESQEEARKRARGRAVGPWTGFVARRIVTPFTITEGGLSSGAPEPALEDHGVER